MRVVVAFTMVLLAMAAPLTAQQPGTRPAGQGVREQVIEKLRALDRASRPGPAATAADSVAGVGADSLAQAGTATPDGIVADTTQAGADDAGRARPDTTGPGAPIRPIPGRPGIAEDSLARVSADARAPEAAKGEGGARPAAGATPDEGGAPTDTATAAEPEVLRLEPGQAIPIIVHVPPDSLEAALRRMEGYALTEYRADGSARYATSDGKLELVGSPSLKREGQSIRSDSLLVYDEPRAILCGYGKPVLEGSQGDPVESEQVCYDVDRQLGVAIGARTKHSQAGSTWFVYGEELYTREHSRLYGANTSFTSCDLEEPHYHFAARSVKIVHNEILVARDVTLRFQDVPVFWLPFLVQSMKDGRRSGLLTPQFAITDIVRNRAGYDRRLSNLGFYWSINDYMGARVAFEWWSDHWVALNSGLQYRWDRQFLNGGVNLTRYWEVDGRKRLGLTTNHSWRPGERTSVNVSGNFQAADLIEKYSFDPQQLDRSINSSASINHRFDWGTLNIGADRTQYLTQEQTSTTFPSVTLNLTPITLFPAAGQARWYNNATWNGNVSYRSRSMERDETLRGVSNRDTRDRTAQLSSSFTLGNFSWSQNAQFTENVRGAKPWIPDPRNPIAIGDTALAREVGRTVTWNSALSYSQRLIGTSTFAPSVSLGGEIRDSDTMEPVAGPTRISFGASLNTNIFGFWPGFGPFSRLRHRIDPSISYSYSPAPVLTPRQIEVFGEQASRPTNRISIGFNQTWEAKYADTEPEVDEAEADTLEAGTPGEPRRLPQARKITLLSLSTNALVYDFTRAREGDYGLETTQLSHNIRSDLLEGLSLSVGYDLFEIERGAAGQRDRRSFSPSLRSVQTSFSLDSNSWLFRMLGLGREAAKPDTVAADTAGVDEMEPSSQMVGPSSGLGYTPTAMDAVGTWRADLTYSLSRTAQGDGNQLLRGTVSFQPTTHWKMRWQTGYSFTDHAFSDHVLTLTRDLHRWQANFSFIQTRTGNFMFSFHVNLIDNTDLELKYDERFEGQRPGLR